MMIPSDNYQYVTGIQLDFTTVVGHVDVGVFFNDDSLWS